MDTQSAPVDVVRAIPETGEASPIEHVHEIVLALATSWTTFGLYPDPTSQPAFGRSVELLQDDLTDPIILSVGPGTLSFGETVIGAGREAVERLAKALFLHDVEGVVVVGNATPQGLVELFEMIAAEPAPDAAYDLGERSLDVDGGGMELFGRGSLNGPGGSGDQQETADDVSQLAEAAFSGASPEELAESIMGAGDDPSDTFVSGFGEVHSLVAPSRRRFTLAQMKGHGDDPWKGLRSLVEAFFFLPRPVQITILEDVLADVGNERNRVFLDQLSGIDLAGFLPDLPESSSAVLLEYAVASSGTTDGQPTELLETLQAARDVQNARMAMAERVSSLLLHPEEGSGRPLEEMLDRLRIELGEFPGREELGREVLRGLLECEQRPDRFRRVVRMWTGRVARTIRNGDFPSADRLLNDILDDPPYGVDKEGVVDEGLARMTTPDLLRCFVDGGEDGGSEEHASRVLRRLAPRVFDQMVDRLAETEDSHERRMLTELLAASLTDVRRIEVHLNDPRWFVVRNLAIVLGKSGKPAAVTPLQRIMRHEEPRVRVEAVRSLVRLLQGDSASLLIDALDDEHPRVRTTALALLKSSEFPDIDERVATYLTDERVDPDVGKALIAFLAERGTPKAIEAVKQIGGRRFAARGNERAVRDAARAVMKRSGW